MIRIVYCSGCKKKVAEIVEGSKLIRDISMLCPNCETKRKMSDLANKTSPSYDQFFNGIFK